MAVFYIINRKVEKLFVRLTSSSFASVVAFNHIRHIRKWGARRRRERGDCAGIWVSLRALRFFAALHDINRRVAESGELR